MIFTPFRSEKGYRLWSVWSGIAVFDGTTRVYQGFFLLLLFVVLNPNEWRRVIYEFEIEFKESFC